MKRINDQFTVAKYTVLLFDELHVTGSGKTVTIDGKTYSTEMAVNLIGKLLVKTP